MPKAYARERFGLAEKNDADDSVEEDDERTQSATKILAAVDAAWDSNSDSDTDFRTYKRTRRRQSFGERKHPPLHEEKPDETESEDNNKGSGDPAADAEEDVNSGQAPENLRRSPRIAKRRRMSEASPYVCAQNCLCMRSYFVSMHSLTFVSVYPVLKQLSNRIAARGARAQTPICAGVRG